MAPRQPTTQANDALEDRLAGVLRGFSPRITCAYLFGSQSRGDARASSDVDIAVLFSDDAPARLLGPVSQLRGELERALNREVDVIDLQRAPPDLVHRILRDGRLLLDQDPDARIAFEVAARNAYFDVLPHLERYRRAGHA